MHAAGLWLVIFGLYHFLLPRFLLPLPLPASTLSSVVGYVV